jgi:hypothetical protein
MDLVFFAGPVMVTDAFKRINWLGSTVKIVPVQGSGSSYFSSLAEELRDSSGRILPNLLARYAPGITPSRIALAAYSAGHGLLNKIALVDADRKATSAMVLSDATFSGFQDPPKPGYVAFGVDAARGKRLLVSTTANTSDGSYRTGRDSYALVWNETKRLSGATAYPIEARPGVPQASGGWWRLGSDNYWGNYASATGASDLSHAAHHELAPAIWQAYLAPYWAGLSPVAWAALGITAGAAVVFGPDILKSLKLREP